MAEARRARASSSSAYSGNVTPINTKSGGIKKSGKSAKESSLDVMDVPRSERESEERITEDDYKKRRKPGSKKAPAKKKKTYVMHKTAKRSAVKGDEPRKKHIGAWIALILLVLIGGACAGLYFYANVESITVEGNSRFTEQEIINLSGLYTGRNLFLYDLGEAKANIEKDPYVECLSVKRVFPKELHISVREREEYAAISASGGLYCVIDREGFVLDVGRRENLDGLVPVYGLASMGFTTGTYIDMDKTKLRPYVLMELLDAIGDRIGRIVSIDISNSASIRIDTSEGAVVMFGDSVLIPEKVEYMFRALDRADKDKLPGTVIYVNSNGTADLAYPTEIPQEPVATDEPTETEPPEETAEPTEEDIETTEAP